MMHWLRQKLELADPRHHRMLPMEGLRGLAVTLVFLQHYCFQALDTGSFDPATTAFAASLRRYGNNGVELFFVLSGFLIYGTLISKRPRFNVFMRRRFERLYPAYICVVALAVVLHLSLRTGKIPSDLIDAIVYIGANLLFLPGLFPIKPNQMFLVPQLRDVLLYHGGLGVSVFALDRRSRTFRLCLIGGAALLLTAAALIFGVSGQPGGIPIRALPFFAGMLLWEVAGAGWKGASGSVGLIALALGFTISCTVSLPPVTQEWVQTISLALLCSACFSGGNIAAMLFRWMPLRWLGNMSYSYYLLHGVIALSAFALLQHVFGSFSTVLFWIMLLPTYLATIIGSFVLFVAIERPFSLRVHPALTSKAVAVKDIRSVTDC